MINIIEYKKSKETFIFVGTLGKKETILKVKAKSIEKANEIINKICSSRNIKISEAYLLQEKILSEIDTITEKDIYNPDILDTSK